jgi:hypothetical protein
MKVYELEDGKQTQIPNYASFELPFNAGTGYWMLPGRYRIELTKEIVGLTYDFDIKAGEETVLELPSLP